MNYNRIKEWLAAKHRTAVELANHLKVSRQAVSYWSRNIKQPEVATLYKIADFLDVEVSDLLTKRSDLKSTRKEGFPTKKPAKKVKIKPSKAKKKDN